MIDNWPRTIQFGIFSVAAALVLGFAGEILKFSRFGTVLQLGALSPTLLAIDLNLSLVTLMSFTAGIWFLIGVFLGKVIDNPYTAALLWITILVSGSWTSYILYKYI